MYSIDRAPFNRSQKIAVVTSDVGYILNLLTNWLLK